jgi:hypothetical protein
VRIKIERSGGIAGITFCHEMDCNKLPPSLKDTVTALLDSKEMHSIKSKSQKNVADVMSYKITIQNGGENHIFNYNEFEMDRNVKSLASFVEKNSANNKII